jgi:ferredoxin
MIGIQIDERACVGCAMCVDACETSVFSFDEQGGLPVVGEVRECFGCLACAEACPSNAIDHTGVVRSQNYYYDEHSIDILSKLTANPEDLGADMRNGSVQKGIDDLDARLLSLSAVLRATLSAGLPAVGTFAGRTLANQLPRYRVPRDIDEALALAVEEFSPAWEIEPHVDGGKMSVTVKGCHLRRLCSKEGVETGGDPCTLFYHYLAGYIGKMCKMRLRLTNTDRGCESCTYTAEIHTA